MIEFAATVLGTAGLTLLGLWALFLAWFGYTRRWVLAARLNGMTVIPAAGIFMIARSEEADPASIGALAMAGLALFIAAGGLWITFVGWLVRCLNDTLIRRNRIGQEN